MTSNPQHLPILVRPATHADLAAIQEIERRSFPHAAELFSDRKVRHLIRSRRAVTVVAEADDRILGWATGFVWKRTGESWGRVYSLAIDPHARGRKLGESLLRHLIDELRRRKAGTILLEVRADNHGAKKLYEKFGFQVQRMLPNFYAAGVDAIRMKLPAQPAV